ncbi:MAG: ArsR/SmtB family transcription factor [Candidatus Helarchaeota archaeon]
MEGIENRIVNFLKNVAHPIRIRIIETLRGNVEKSVNEIQNELGEKQSTISQHLKKLTDVNIVTFRKKGQKSLYKIKNQSIHEIFSLIINYITEQTIESIDDLTSRTIRDTLT